MKTCFKCHIEKPLSEFYVHKMMADGHLNKCKECTKKYTAEREARLSKTDFEWKEKELERHRIKSAKARKNGTAAKPSKKTSSKWSAANANKKRAHKKVHRAIQAGQLIPQPCEICGSKSKIEAHHDDYSKPLDVRWLCPKHHGEAHREINRQRRLARFQELQKQIKP